MQCFKCDQHTCVSVLPYSSRYHIQLNFQTDKFEIVFMISRLETTGTSVNTHFCYEKVYFEPSQEYFYFGGKVHFKQKCLLKYYFNFKDSSYNNVATTN